MGTDPGIAGAGAAPSHGTPLVRPALRLAVPSIVENLFHSAVYSVDVLMLGMLGERELAASSLTSMFLWRTTMVTASLQYGVAAYVARRWGAGDFALARRAATHATLLSALLGAIVAAIVIPFLPLLFRGLGAPSDVIQLATAFTTPILIVFPLVQMRTILGASLRAAGDTLTPQLATLVVNVLNVAFNYVLIFGKFGVPAMGMPGAGIGTAMALSCGFLFLAWRAGRGVRPRRLFAAVEVVPAEEDMRQEPVAPLAEAVSPGRMRSGVFAFSTSGLRLWISGITGPILRVTRSALVEELLVTAGFFGFIRLIAGMGTTSLAAHSAVSAIESFSYNAGAGFAVAASTLVGQALGRRDPALALRAMGLALSLAIVTMGTLGILFSLAPTWFLQWYLPRDADPAFMLLAVQLLLIAAVEQPLLGATQTLSGSLRGAGDTLSPTYAQLAGTITVRLAMGWLLGVHMGMGVVGLYLATVIDWGVRAGFLGWCVLRGRWRRIAL